LKNNRFVALVLIPALGLLTLFIVVPIMGSFIFSLFDYNPLRDSNPFLGLENYRRLFSDPTYLISLRNTLVFVFATVAVNISLTLLLGQFIHGIGRKWLRNLFLIAIFLPCVAPVANSAVVWSRSLFPPRGGLFNMIIEAFGGTPLNWLGSPPIILPALILFTV
jgi:ABC-type sugar transport system permease subunit